MPTSESYEWPSEKPSLSSPEIQPYKSKHGRGRTKLPSDEALVALYTQERLSRQAIAAKYQVSGETVFRVLKHLGLIDGRRRAYHLLPSAEVLHRHYHEEHMTLDDIARLYGVTCAGVRLKFIKDGIRIRTKAEAHAISQRVPQSPWAEIKRLWDEGMEAWPIARELGLHGTTVYKQLQRHGEKCRRRYLSTHGKALLPPPQEIVELYREQQLSTNAIASRYGCSPQVVDRALDAAGIVKRTTTENNLIAGMRRRKLPNGTAKLLYEEGKSPAEIAEMWKLSRETVYKELHLAGVTLACNANNMSRSLEYKRWHGMHQRVSPKNKHNRHLYFDRGIKVCAEWCGPQGFVNWFRYMGPCPGPGYSIERIDNDKGYEPGNVRWATAKEQVANRRCTLRVEVNGHLKTVTEVMAETGLDRQTVTYRLKNGWSADQIYAIPQRHRQRAVETKQLDLFT